MTWVEHSLVGTGIYIVSRGLSKKLSLSVLLIASTVLMDIDHLWFRIASKTILREYNCLSLGFLLSSCTWTHSLVYLFCVSSIFSFLFTERKKIFTACMLGGFFHLLGDWLYRQWIFDMGIMWLWPFSWKMF